MLQVIFVFFAYNGMDTTTSFPSGRLRIDRASLLCEHRFDRRVSVTRHSYPLETAASKILDGLTRTVESVFVIRHRI